MPSFSLHEPFPSLSSKRPTYMPTGRGGAGNITRATPETVAERNTSLTGPTASLIAGGSVSSRSSGSSRMMTGRGGAGNAQPLSQKALFSFDEELERVGRLERDPAPVYHIGRGGAGNLVGKKSGGSINSEGSSRKGSASESENGEDRRSGDWLRRLRNGGN